MHDLDLVREILVLKLSRAHDERPSARELAIDAELDRRERERTKCKDPAAWLVRKLDLSAVPARLELRVQKRWAQASSVQFELLVEWYPDGRRDHWTKRIVARHAEYVETVDVPPTKPMRYAVVVERHGWEPDGGEGAAGFVADTIMRVTGATGIRVRTDADVWEAVKAERDAPRKSTEPASDLAVGAT